MKTFVQAQVVQEVLSSEFATIDLARRHLMHCQGTLVKVELIVLMTRLDRCSVMDLN